MTVEEADLVNFEGPQYDIARAPINRVHLMDHARPSHPSPERYRAVVRLVKTCLSCMHWARFHPHHGPCVGAYYHGPGHFSHCVCAGFSDPEPGRPDQIYTRDQIDRMNKARWESRKDRIFLLRDGYYGLWDEWSSPEWLAQPGQVFKPWLGLPVLGEAPTSPQEPLGLSSAPLAGPEAAAGP